MSSIYHPGELKVQELAGVSETAEAMSRMVQPYISYQFIDFIQTQPMVICSSADSAGMVWGSFLDGQPGFMRVVDEQTLVINAFPDDGDPLRKNIQESHELGLLVIDFSTRRRLRLNGSAEIGRDGITMRTRQVYANCPKYIQSRRYETDPNTSLPPRVLRQATSLSGEQQQFIRRADTFFLGSFHPLGGADCSHRGGYPGFVQVIDASSLAWPDYNGNSMFNSLGNIVEHPNAGLLFIDFEHGGTLQISGRASIAWEEERALQFPGAERIIEFTIFKVIETENATALRWRFTEYSQDNPWFC